MKKLLCLLICCCLLFTGCSNVREEADEEGKDYDVIVIGGDPEGICAAVSSARNGMKTLLIEEDGALGGLMTRGKLNFIDMCEGRDKTLLTQGLFSEFYEAVGGTAFDLRTAEDFFTKWLDDEPNATVKLNTKLIEPIMEESGIEGVVVKENGKEVTYTSSCVIDATVDADVAAATGVPYTVAGEDIGEKHRHMGVTLVFELSDVDWKEVADYLRHDGDDETGVTAKTAWGYSKEGYAYKPKDPLMRLRGFNVAKQNDGNVLVNALIIFGVDTMNPESKAEGIARAEEELKYIIPYINEHFEGFEHAKLAGTASELYIRESRHIIGEYQLTIDDVLENRDQWDKIALGSYPADIQPTAKQTYGTVIGNPDRYAIPFRSLVPLKVDNLLVIGRSASYTSLAAGSARVIPVGMAEGQAAGVAAAYSVNKDKTFREMTESKRAIASIQKTLKEQGAYLEDFEIHDEVMDHWAYEGLKVIRGLGQWDGGYDNNYHLDEAIKKKSLRDLINKTMRKTDLDFEWVKIPEDPTNADMIGNVAKVLGIEEQDYDAQVEILKEKGILTEEILKHMGEKNERAFVAEAIMIVANMYTFVVQ